MISKNLNKVEEKILASCRKSGRNRSEIRLIAVSKTHSINEIEEVLNTGITDLGENKAQELNGKFPQIAKSVNWHFIGHLQTNKVKYIIEPAEFIHSIDSIKLAAEINKRANGINKTQKILLEIKTSDEASKFGLTDEDKIFEVAEFCKNCESLDLVGLMTMAPYSSEENIIRNCFVKLRNTKDTLNQKGFNLKELSMGMTNDYEIAIEEGATMIRVGTAIFGERDYSTSSKVI